MLLYIWRSIDDHAYSASADTAVTTKVKRTFYDFIPIITEKN